MLAGGGHPAVPPIKWHESAMEGVFVAIARCGDRPPPSKWHESALEGVFVVIGRCGSG